MVTSFVCRLSTNLSAPNQLHLLDAFKNVEVQPFLPDRIRCQSTEPKAHRVLPTSKNKTIKISAGRAHMTSLYERSHSGVAQR